MRLKKKREILFFTISLGVAGLGLFCAINYSFAQTGTDVENRRSQLEKDLTQLESEIDAQQKILQTKQRDSVSLERDIAILDAQVHSAELSIKARDLVIKKLTAEISGKANTIGTLTQKINREKESLGQLVRKSYEIESFSIVEIVLSNEDFSNFFQDLDSFDSIKSALKESFEQITNAKNQTAKEKTALEDKQSEELELKKLQELQKRQLETNKNERQRILKDSKGQEAKYQQIIKDKQKSAAAIRTELFGLRGSAAIPFEKALDYANFAGGKTGVRAALILGIIAEESNLGENVGTGYWKTDMHPTRDQPIFIEICRKLGLDPEKMPVSKRAWYGWGGAMGPAQFIPSTWVLYEDRIARLIGNSPANPWDPRDAFTGAALLLKDNGAGAGTYAAERLAALRYLAGWNNAKKAAYAFYGDDVMALAQKYQQQINILQNN